MNLSQGFRHDGGDQRYCTCEECANRASWFIHDVLLEAGYRKDPPDSKFEIGAAQERFMLTWRRNGMEPARR